MESESEKNLFVLLENDDCIDARNSRLFLFVSLENYVFCE